MHNFGFTNYLAQIVCFKSYKKWVQREKHPKNTYTFRWMISTFSILVAVTVQYFVPKIVRYVSKIPTYQNMPVERYSTPF